MFATDQREACSPFREKGRGYYRTDRAKGKRHVCYAPKMQHAVPLTVYPSLSWEREKKSGNIQLSSQQEASGLQWH